MGYADVFFLLAIMFAACLTDLVQNPTRRHKADMSGAVPIGHPVLLITGKALIDHRSHPE